MFNDELDASVFSSGAVEAGVQEALGSPGQGCPDGRCGAGGGFGGLSDGNHCAPYLHYMLTYHPNQLGALDSWASRIGPQPSVQITEGCRQEHEAIMRQDAAGRAAPDESGDANYRTIQNRTSGEFRAWRAKVNAAADMAGMDVLSAIKSLM